MSTDATQPLRLRFAPSPTGALHIGGIRTALYNYLLVQKHGGSFILRIEDTDQTRYVPGAEDYIKEALNWCGITFDEGPYVGGDYGPYRQSERKDLYQKYVQQLIDNGRAYYAFDTAEELDAMRERLKEEGNHAPQYNAVERQKMNNSLTLSADEVKMRLERGDAYTVRLKVEPGETITFDDLVRGEVSFQSDALDDKILLKSDGLPTYHMANIVDDHLMKITHVIRGEEWLSSTAHHILLYRALDWDDTRPAFAHIPLILKPNGKGKLSKRDGDKYGIPVFPISWQGGAEVASFTGFREYGYYAPAVNNFLAFLGWNPGTERELFNMEDLIQEFSIERINKSGARFDIDKAKWYNQQYILQMDDEVLANEVRPYIEEKGHNPSPAFLQGFVQLYKERAMLFPEFWEKGYFFFEEVAEYQQKMVRKKWKPERLVNFETLDTRLENLNTFSAEKIEETVKTFMADFEYGFGDVLPILRLAVAGTTQGPPAFEMMSLLGQQEVVERLRKAYPVFTELKNQVANG